VIKLSIRGEKQAVKTEKEILNEKEKNNVRELAEMYLCSKILSDEIYKTVEQAVETEKEISTLLALKTGKPLNSIYRDKNDLPVYNTPSLFRYWQAMQDICKERHVPNDKIPNLNEILSKYQNIIHFISQVTNEINLNSLIENNTDVIFEIVLFYNQRPLPTQKKKVKQDILTKITKYPKIQEKLIDKQKADLAIRREGMIRVD